MPAHALLLSLLAWTCETAMIVLAARAMGLQVSFPLATVVLLGINLAMALPSTPASAGPFEGATVAVLMFAGIGKGPALAFPLFYHAIQVIPVTVAGVAMLLLAKQRHSTRASRLQDKHAETTSARPATAAADADGNCVGIAQVADLSRDAGI